MPDSSISFHVLSPVDVRLNGRVLNIAAPRQRALVALLLVNPNECVSTATLIDGIWGGESPQHPESALHIVVCRLRRALDVIAPRLVREGSGYRLEIRPDELDLACARSHFSRAQCAMRDGDMELAAAGFDAALECWTGEPLADLAKFPFYDNASRHLREFRLGLVELRNSAYLQCGRHLEVLDDVETWVRTEPWRERLRAHQMVALYRSGRQIDALAAYEDIRRLLVNDFGVEPCDDLQRLHGRILRQDPTLLDNRSAIESRVRRLREIARGPADVVLVEGGPGVDKAWLIAEAPLDVGEGVPRVTLGAWLATLSVKSRDL